MNAICYNSISALRTDIVSPKSNSEWSKKMLHVVPDLPTVKDRAAYLVEKSRDKVVLDIGSSGAISKAIRAVSSKYYGVDKSGEDVFECDLDESPELLPIYPDVQIIILSEVLEHLANPGNFLKSLRQRYSVDIFITVPNAGAYTTKDECEVVNKDHVSWYSYTTLKNLLERYGFKVQFSRWYNTPNGEFHKSEGLIFLVN